ncbi:hypothetical protein LTR09_008043 [Extremus antarcticus]|uniref:BTB domain-containing protein n=1 Tax=Extremus antarcticus TaxID=702011 RepID=A0AAJ0DB53_9PEZI|nr:hypothetical protein LTR09_008043 [Extremus antarcticus]
MDPTTPMGDISRYFDSAKHSDVTIKFSGHELKAHKIRLCCASDYFRGAFEGNFQEASSNILELHYDDPDAIKGLVAWVYGLYYDGRGTFSPSPCQPTSGDLRWARRHLVNLFAAAKKYLVLSLSEHMKNRTSAVESYDFLYALISLTPGTGYPPAIEEMVGYLYDPARDPASELRKTLVGLVAWRLELFLGDEEARKKTRTLIIDEEEFGSDLLTRARQGGAVSLATGDWRKALECMYEDVPAGSNDGD